jgi:hypothetical protein
MMRTMARQRLRLLPAKSSTTTETLAEKCPNFMHSCAALRTSELLIEARFEVYGGASPQKRP